MTRFTGRVAFITGVARGQGREHAVRLAAEGASIIGLDSCAPPATTTYEPATEADLAETVAAVEEAGGRMVGRVADVRDAAAVQAVVDEGVATLGRLDHVIANAAVCSYGRLWELTPEQWTEMVDVNLTGVWHTLRASVPTLIEQGRGGSIVITSSGAGLKGLPLLSHYGATKWAVTGLARSLANEVAEHSIRVNTVHPTAVRTPMGDDPGLARGPGRARAPLPLLRQHAPHRQDRRLRRERRGALAAVRRGAVGHGCRDPGRRGRLAGLIRPAPHPT